MTSRRFWLFAAAAGAALTANSHAYAQAQSTESDVIIVTAQKREQNIQDVPIAINAFSGAQLEQSNIGDVNDLQLITPSLFVNTTNSGASNTTLRIRGVGTTGNNPGLEGAVGVFIDGVYRNRSGMALNQLADIQRVEVLRGPQSTLFGKNTSAGALSIITNRPNLSDAGGGGALTYGDPGIVGVQGWANAPLGESFALRVTGGAETREGWVENRNTGVKNHDVARGFVRAQGLWELASNADLRVILDYSTVGNNATTAVRAHQQAAGCHATIPAIAVIGCRSRTINLLEGAAGRSLTGEGFFDSNSLTYDGENDEDDWGASAELNWDIGDSVTMTNIIAYRDYDRTYFYDVDFTGADVLNTRGTEGYQTFSDELRFVGETGQLEWLFGVYYSNEEVDALTRLEFGTQSGSYLCGLFTANTVAACFNPTGFQPPAIPVSFVPAGSTFNPNHVIAGQGSTGLFNTEAESWSVFAQGTYHLTDQFSATLGLRYIDDHKTGSGDNTVDNLVAAADGNTLPPFLGAVHDFAGAVDDSVVTGTFNVQYEWTPDVMTYASYSRGYKAGGINLDRTAATVITFAVGPQPMGSALFDPEFSDNYEIGLKSLYADGKAGLNLTAFHTEFEDLQILTFTGLAFIVENMPDSQSEGVELEGFVTPADGLVFNLGVTYADTEYGANAILHQVPPNPDRDLTGKHFTNAPVWSGSLGAGYTHDVGADLEGYLRADYFYGSRRNTSSAQEDDKFQDGYGVLNFRAGLGRQDRGWDLSVWCRNCLDEEYYTVLFNSVFQNATGTNQNVDGFIGNLREIGVTLAVDF